MPIGRYFKISFAILFMSIVADAKEVTVFDVRRPVSLSNEEMAPKDYYIDAGSNDGLKPGMTISVRRRQSLYDGYQNKSLEDLVVVIGRLRLIHVQADISVARLENIEKRDQSPTVEFDAVMVGDKVDLSSARMAPQKTASADLPIEVKIDQIAPLPVPTIQNPPTPPSGKADFSSTSPQAPVKTSGPL